MSHYKQVVILVVLLKFNTNINCDKGNKTNRIVIAERKTNSTVIDKNIEEYKMTYKMAKSLGTVTTNFRDVGVSTEDQKFYSICPHFKENKLNIHNMVDVWQTVYYQATEKVPCFKILIRSLSTIERKLNAQKYGSFQNKVFWDNCTLEIKSESASMKHFLQETSLGHGILLNVIIEIGNETKLTTEGPDQWFVQRNLLLMKDCCSGDVVVFARVPFLPRKDVIMEGLKLVGGTGGKYTCVDPATSSHYKDVEFEIFGDVNEFI